MKEFFHLSEGVFLVKGTRRYALYNTVSGSVYSLNEDAVILLSRMAKGDLNEIDYQLMRDIQREQLVIAKETPGIVSVVSRQDAPSYIQKSHKLNFLWLELTNNCNLRCIHCYANAGAYQISNESLSVSDWYQVLDDAFFAGARQVQLIGGEPLLYRGFLRLVNYAFNLGFKYVEIFTNGLLIRDTLLKELSKYSGVRFALSLYSYAPHTHDTITTVEGSWDKTMRAIELLQQFGFPVRVEMVVMQQNQNDIEPTMRLLKKLGVYSRRPDIVRPTGRGGNSAFTPSKPEVMKLRVRTAPDFRTTMHDFFNAMFWNSCWAGKVAVTANGNVIPCIFARDFVVGSIKEQGLSSILRSDALMSYWKITKDHISVCKDCEYRYACHDCRPLAISDSGNLLDKGSFCTYNPYDGVWNPYEYK